MIAMPVTRETTKLHVSGMNCEGCAKRVTRVLERLVGVFDATVTLEDETAQVDYDATEISVEALTRAIDTAGYTAEEKES